MTCVLTTLIAGSVCSQKQSILEWYPIADSMTNFPPIGQSLLMVSKKVERVYITFVGINGQPKVLLAAITNEPVADVKSISLIVGFSGVKPTTGKVSTWGYVFDRNSDGKIDYMAMLGGAAADEGEDFPADFPEGKGVLNKKQIEYFVGHCKLIFDHWADDNYDGKFDALVQNDCDPKRDLVMRQILVRSTAFNDTFNDVWGFRADIRGDRDSIDHSPRRVPYRLIGRGNGAITPKTLLEKNAILALVNRAAKALNLDKVNFYHPEEKDD